MLTDTVLKTVTRFKKKSAALHRDRVSAERKRRRIAWWKYAIICSHSEPSPRATGRARAHGATGEKPGCHARFRFRWDAMRHANEIYNRYKFLYTCKARDALQKKLKEKAKAVQEIALPCK